VIRLVPLIVTVMVAATACGDEVWVLRGVAGGCRGPQWFADALLFNTSDEPAVVRLLSVSDGPDQIVRREITIRPRGTIVLSRNATWSPNADVKHYMVHMDVPAAVTVQGVLNVGYGIGLCLPGPPLDTSAAFGAAAFPHFRGLIPANQEQVHLGTDLGFIRSRNNVGIFNAGAVAAVAQVELRRACDDAVLAVETVAVPANSTTQVRVENDSLSDCSAGEDFVQEWVDVISVRVSQPSVSWVSTIAEGVPPRVLFNVR
jgi:hypothetical protein